MTREEFDLITTVYDKIVCDDNLKIKLEQDFEMIGILCSINDYRYSFDTFGSADEMIDMWKSGESFFVVSVNSNAGRVSLRSRSLSLRNRYEISNDPSKYLRFAFHYSDLILKNKGLILNLLKEEKEEKSPYSLQFNIKDLANSIFEGSSKSDAR